MALSMRIDDMVKSAIGGPLPAPSAVRKARADLAETQAGGDKSSGRGGGGNLALAGGYDAATFVDPGSADSGVRDDAQFSPAALAQSRAAKGGATGAEAAPDDAQPTEAGGTNFGGAVVDEYVRRRAVMAYTVPVGRGVLNLTLEVESAYRVTQLVLPGSNLDTTA